MTKKHTQVDDIIETMQKNGGYETLASQHSKMSELFNSPMVL